ncbi:hypothetical protein [Epibacterium sp. Ofav1-8]|uniref:hypothetical protein n=1 Tax=Epibacterium sp. Ofav1-8 TaxID=2917735 RepID=UPI001EF4E15D|nr:hypothetical protein [Epibacterium sp. Ofav1-8]MCG7625259.1 hypothetical protein [Epibacterium sp. Ofav1-8]
MAVTLVCGGLWGSRFADPVLLIKIYPKSSRIEALSLRVVNASKAQGRNAALQKSACTRAPGSVKQRQPAFPNGLPWRQNAGISGATFAFRHSHPPKFKKKGRK